MNLTYKLVESIKQTPSVMWAGLIKLVHSLNRTKRLNSSEQEGILPAQCFLLFYYSFFIYLAVPGLSSQLQHAGSLVGAYGIF